MKKYGNQTPTQAVILDYTESLGGEAVGLYKRTGLEPYPWQENLISTLFAVNAEGLWTHSRFGYAIPRCNELHP